MNEAMPAVETTLVIRTYNEAKHLGNLFDALDAQSYRDFETVVVDSGSTDRSRDIAAVRADRLIAIPKDDFTFGHSLNVGIGAGRGRFAAIASAHTVPRDGAWLERLIAPLRSDDGTAMTYGRQLGRACSKFSEVEDFERSFGPHPRIERPDRFAVNNANAAIRRSLWEKKPFDVLLPGLEDIGFAQYWMERGHRVVYEPEAVLVHIHEESWAQIRRRYYREGIAARQLSIRGWRSIPSELAREIAFTAGDLIRACSPGANPVAARLSLGQRLREVLYFRLHKNIGTVAGLLRSRPIESRAEREAFYFDHAAANIEEVPLPPRAERQGGGESPSPGQAREATR